MQEVLIAEDLEDYLVGKESGVILVVKELRMLTIEMRGYDESNGNNIGIDRNSNHTYGHNTYISIVTPYERGK